jgi:hypothetical protein
LLPIHSILNAITIPLQVEPGEVQDIRLVIDNENEFARHFALSDASIERRLCSRLM